MCECPTAMALIKFKQGEIMRGQCEKCQKIYRTHAMACYQIQFQLTPISPAGASTSLQAATT